MPHFRVVLEAEDFVEALDLRARYHRAYIVKAPDEAGAAAMAEEAERRRGSAGLSVVAAEVEAHHEDLAPSSDGIVRSTGRAVLNPNPGDPGIYRLKPLSRLERIVRACRRLVRAILRGPSR